MFLSSYRNTSESLGKREMLSAPAFDLDYFLINNVIKVLQYYFVLFFFSLTLYYRIHKKKRKIIHSQGVA